MYALSVCVVPLWGSEGPSRAHGNVGPLLPRKGGGTTGGRRAGESCPHPVLPADEGTSHMQKKNKLILKEENKGLFFNFFLFFIYSFYFFSSVSCGSTESLKGTGSWESHHDVWGLTALLPKPVIEIETH